MGHAVATTSQQENELSNLKVNLLCGDTGTTKTSRLGDAAEYYAEKFQKPVRGVFSDTGGYGSIQHLVDNGTVIPFVLTSERGDTMIEDMDKLSRGWWPANPEDTKSKLVYGPMDKVSALLFDGATSWCQMMMTFHEGAVKYVQASDSIVATGVRVPEMPKDSFIRSGDYIRRFTGRSDYGGVQARIKEFIRNSAMLPVPAEWTALETKGSDEGKRPIGGPDFIGQALTGVCGPWFGNILHLDFIEKEVETDVAGTKVKVRMASPYLFTRSHQKQNDPTKLVYMAKTRIDKRLWDKVPPVMAPDLKAFYQLIDKLQDEAKGLQSPIIAKS
jgi:hypothetical protein